MLSRSAMALVTALLMFPQIAETIYSPALTDISAHFSVSAADAAQTLAVYFIGFAIGVLFWGWFSDRRGRRPALLLGLAVYTAGCMLALAAPNFGVLLAARILAAFGAAIGSVVGQTVLRDAFEGRQLAAIFSFVGMALAISPAIGVYSGGVLAGWWGMYGVFSALALLAATLLLLCAAVMPETRPSRTANQALWPLLLRMMVDTKIRLAVALVAALNIGLFSYYSQGPFLFARLGLDARAFGYSGMALAAGALAGAQGNRLLLRRGAGQQHIFICAGLLLLLASAGVGLLTHSWLFLLPMMGVATAYAMAIPVVLGTALSDYGDCRGSAGALLGLAYYLIIGLGLAIVGWGESLGITLAICAAVSALTGWRYLRHMDDEFS
ncbi:MULTISPECIES: MFS transporter [Klebsiella]|jgi:drug resistance transporter, Bcr/CflA subfamily|uniref:MFS transporter n=1 Tax=Klebsiella TaxID=570 RepID=UPI00063C9536|nr:MFS transporter [Klebsiella aerogenes]EIW9476521.1 multidrug effflux MFS transporter [Klebsiella aerogenes]EIW9496724.1 multidrug effflux MFS transporter [Klebsiella aerogenes]EKM7512067.1 MFS transporter [Klebsiella aerogenes]EKV8808639.1 MFS transporter [Klebsiella aerogenes]ELJ2005636.1 MFS transporter [Klebsiella aerogenes]